jgi:hypothetical protein
MAKALARTSSWAMTPASFKLEFATVQVGFVNETCLSWIDSGKGWRKVQECAVGQPNRGQRRIVNGAA